MEMLGIDPRALPFELHPQPFLELDLESAGDVLGTK
jgi:hypothetical protein